jgi:tetratricopeptide (TPR) repeat protein
LSETTDRVKTRTQLVEEAIAAALDGAWPQALELNQQILERFGSDEEVQNRLGKAYTELGKVDEALSSYKATLELNPLNGIAIKNVNRLEAMIQEKSAPKQRGQAGVDVNLFVEEMGKTALAAVRLDKKADVAMVTPGDQVELVASGDRDDDRPCRTQAGAPRAQVHGRRQQVHRRRGDVGGQRDPGHHPRDLPGAGVRRQALLLRAQADRLPGVRQGFAAARRGSRIAGRRG